MRTCSDCGHQLIDDPKPCPSCGGTRQNAHVHATATVGLGTATNPGLSIEYGQQRPWYSQWMNVRQELEEVEARCRPESYRGNPPIKLAFEDFFIHCFHFGDWLWEDKSTGLSKSKVWAFIADHPAMGICAGFANTTKHRTRRKSTDLTAVVSSVTHDDTGVRAVVTWTEYGVSGMEDALDLARRCVVAWEAFLKTERVQLPG